MVLCWTSVGPFVCQSYICQSIHILFPDDNLNKHQWIFTKLGMCIDFVEIWFGIANGHNLSNFDGHIFVFWTIT